MSGDFQSRASAVLPAAVMDLLQIAGQVAQQAGRELFLVGGAVRDVLLDRPTEDIDLVVLGLSSSSDSPGLLVEGLASALEATVEAESRFRTWRLALPDGRRLDVAEARRESYSARGALPMIEAAPLESDLGRRDFAINAMAVALGPTWSAPIDPYDGARDLAEGRLRVLHPASFDDDPSRILRGLEFGQRLGFEFDQPTRDAARRTLASGGLATLSPARFRMAWQRAFGRLIGRGETALVAGLESARVLGLLGALGVTLSPQLRLAAARLTESAEIGLLSRAANARLLIRALARDNAQNARGLAALWSAQEGERASWASFAAQAKSLGEEARHLLRPSQVASVLEAFDDEDLAVLDLFGDQEIDTLLATYRERVEPIRLAVSGRDLIARGHDAGPEIGVALAATRDARLDGLITAAEELEYACAQLSRASRT